MVETVYSAALPVGEKLLVQKNCLLGHRRAGRRVAIVTGMHGDGLAGQFVAYELIRRLNESPSKLRGMVDVYPALNPLGLSARTHGVPQFDIDLDRSFPGNASGNLTDALASAVFEDVVGASACVIIQSSDSFVQEVSQARIDEGDSSSLMRIASLLNVRLIWLQESAPTLRSTLAHALNERGTPAFVVRLGSNVSQAENEAVWIVEGILRLLKELRVWSGSTIDLPAPMVSSGDDVVTLLADEPGLFLPRIECGAQVRRGQVLGLVVDSLEGVVKSELKAPCSGLLFSLRTYPIVYPGSLLARILEG
ncbi:MAG: succinylglutamate desuccinylase/aspartoacylase family protein [Atopobiaceae bacterium]|nr:succinylglutamate desuccinylase/aspartoacylase family protein [Atopobiaceae bacterium]